MSKFKMLGLRRRTTTVRSHQPGQAPTTSLDGIELVLEYIPQGSFVTAEEEAKCVESVRVFNETIKDGVFLNLDESPVLDAVTALSDTLTGEVEIQKWKAKYDEAESKRRGLQLKVNEYKRKLGLTETADTTSESASAKSGKGKRKAGAGNL